MKARCILHVHVHEVGAFTYCDWGRAATALTRSCHAPTGSDQSHIDLDRGAPLFRVECLEVECLIHSPGEILRTVVRSSGRATASH